MRKQAICIYGAGCCGKSASLATIFKLKEQKDLRLIFLAADANAFSGLMWGIKHYNIELQPNQLIFSEVKAKTKKAFSAKLSAFKSFSEGTGKDAYQVGKESSANRSKYTYLVSIIEKLEKFSGIDYVTKEEINLGNIADLSSNDILCIDGLSPISHGIWNLIQGDKLVNDQNDYQIVQKQIYDISQELINSTSCSVIMLAHEEVTKDNKIRIALGAGQALHGKYNGLWTNVIYAYKTNAGGYFWSGKKMNVADIAARDFPESDSLKPDFSLYNFFS